MKTRKHDPVIDAAMASAELEFDEIVERMLEAFRPESAVQFDLVGQAAEMELSRLELLYLFEHDHKLTGEYPRPLAKELISLNARLAGIYRALKIEGPRLEAFVAQKMAARTDADTEAEAAKVLQNFAARTVRNKVQ